ncbi:unnamed protein product [Effrenium voratum]|nr:unnamed protein product [Effrenium voratum]
MCCDEAIVRRPQHRPGGGAGGACGCPDLAPRRVRGGGAGGAARAGRPRQGAAHWALPRPAQRGSVDPWRRERNLPMMALLHFYNLSYTRVGGNTDFEGDDERHHLIHHGLNASLKAEAFRLFGAAHARFEREALRRLAGGRDVSVRHAWISATAQMELSTTQAEVLAWQHRVRSEQNWAQSSEKVGLRLGESATYSQFDGQATSDHGGDVKPTGGFSPLLQKLAEGLDLQLRTAALRVRVLAQKEAEGPQVVVETDTKNFEGAAVIVTVPLAVLQEEIGSSSSPRFLDPGMPLAAFKSLQMGQMAKLFIRFQPGGCPIGGDTYLLSKVVSFDSRALLYYCIREDDIASEIMICLVGGPSEREARGLSSSELQRRVAAELNELFPQQAAAVQEVQLVSFADDPYVLGSWTSGKVGSLSEDFEEFAPKTRVFFAGEHTCRLMYGTTQAAVVSGARAAFQVLGTTVPSSDWPFFNASLYSLCDELGDQTRQELCSTSCAQQWHSYSLHVPSFFSAWEGMSQKHRGCWAKLGWTEQSWRGKRRRSLPLQTRGGRS